MDRVHGRICTAGKRHIPRKISITDSSSCEHRGTAYLSRPRQHPIRPCSPACQEMPSPPDVVAILIAVKKAATATSDAPGTGKRARRAEHNGYTRCVIRRCSASGHPGLADVVSQALQQLNTTVWSSGSSIFCARGRMPEVQPQ